jgi:hypothetical protein
MEGDDTDRWMTFTELSEARGISRASASKLVRRRKWRRQTDNHGTVRILVPPDAMDSPSDGPTVSLPDSPRNRPSDSPSDTIRAISALEAAVAAMQEQQERERAALRELVEEQRARAARAEQHGDDLTIQIEALQAELAAAKDAVERASARPWRRRRGPRRCSRLRTRGG